ncbi:hypothetical protein F9C07_2661 [Aspergillus flavus]|uniref:Uncharacterized protein n=6 Tax=Aspergillus subgen. Circumdati TaxID=2720871 RepID=B8N1Y2_ASPFN|nr:unnamed protein product [Aspergillus oryzae RIB40]XP_041142967.1 uncharacterized protein G4B84_003253 [Aspergillus flavus NRRL3357]EIT76536.1 hypothetical protein Ao3042_07182 [Aspergillus oryzae 3.042]KAB8247154.1 hypothetical protein BDV35DRAFT_205348 [Aspergillus flavus]KDE80449.1 hypothetical protein AO1008_06615 [Aspergillus oryzae 100-8]KOC13920.1 hypothetical protein AFLA70_202g001680 [Aspergillus flavus AF70]OOO10398.1 2OG-Fe(II) oxygenase [Aspergillus oryzae]|eukprot:EIT76536.1 hypothetical protein Ao3042_07182 [Aspergillus oryzae 3.042]
MPPKSKSKKDIAPPKQQQQRQQTPKPNWPPLRPLIPSSDLTLDPLLPDQIYLIPNFFTANLCKTYVSFLSSLPLTTTPGKPKKGDAVRVNDRFQIQDERFAESLWSGTALKDLVMNGDGEGERSMKEIWGGEPLGLNANIRIYRYSKGQFFAQHYDDSNTLTFSSPSHPSQPARTTWTLLIYLTTCSGGETIFYPESTRGNRNPEPVSVAPVTGMALLHRHGDRCLLHEGSEVSDGEKWVLRSDLVVR